MKNHSNNKPGFTLIEIMVTVSILALLVTFLLPALFSAREQARETTCLANLKEIGSGSSMYMTTNRERFPIGPAEKMTFNNPIDEQHPLGEWTLNKTTCHWGGKRGTFTHDPEGKQERQRRPLTQFLYRDYHWEEEFDPVTHRDSVVEFEMFRCPSDTANRNRKGLESLFTSHHSPPRPDAIYEICGNSYYHNMHGEVHMLTAQLESSPSRVVYVNEANLNMQMASGVSAPGWHGQPQQQNILFFDMHAENMRIDITRKEDSDWSIKDFYSARWYYE